MKHPDSALEKIELRGNWKAIDQSKKIPGVLTGSEAEGFYLETSEPLNPDSKDLEHVFASESGIDDHAIVHGETRDGNVTLFDVAVFGSSYRLNSDGLDRIRYRCPIVAKGETLSRIDDLAFPKIRSKFSALGEWVDARPFRIQTAGGFGKLNLDFSIPDAQILFDDPTFTISLEFSYQPPGSRVGQNSLTIEWEPMICIESKGKDMQFDGIDVTFAYGLILWLNQLLTIITRSPSYPYDITGVRRKQGPDASYKWERPVEILVEQDVTPTKYDHRRRMLSWDDFRQHSQQFLGEWIAKHPQLDGPVSLLVGSLRQSSVFSSDRFFNTATALEGIHRVTHRQSSIPSREHTARVEDILSNCTLEHRKWLEDKLSLSHEPSLARRIKDLGKRFQLTFDWLVGAEGNGESRSDRRHSVASSFAFARNVIAHALPETKINGGKLYRFTKLGEAIATLSLFYELGVSADRLDQLMKENYFRRSERDRIVEFLNLELGSEST